MILEKTINIIPYKITKYITYCHISGAIKWKKNKGLDHAGCINVQGYRQIGFKGVLYKAHRLAWFIYYNEQPPKVIDHINGDKTDNRIVNLRKCTYSQNNMNSKINSRNKSGTTGVSFNKNSGKWQSNIHVGKKNTYLGIFDNINDAIKARKDAEKKHYKEFSPRRKLNKED